MYRNPHVEMASIFEIESNAKNSKQQQHSDNGTCPVSLNMKLKPGQFKYKLRTKK